MTELELIELLLLRNRGIVDSPEMLVFDAALVATVLVQILRAGYLRNLNTLPAMAMYPRVYDQLVFSASGRIRFYHLERRLAASDATLDQQKDRGGTADPDP